jgi:hypothetical protein
MTMSAEDVRVFISAMQRERRVLLRMQIQRVGSTRAG